MLYSPPTLLVLWLALAATNLSMRPSRPTDLCLVVGFTCSKVRLTCCKQVHEEFAYGFSEQLLRARATDQVCMPTLFNHTKLAAQVVHTWLHAIGFNESSRDCRPGAAERQAYHRERAASGTMFYLISRPDDRHCSMMSRSWLVCMLQWDEVDQKFKVSEQLKVGSMIVMGWTPVAHSARACGIASRLSSFMFVTCRLQEKQLLLCLPRSTLLPSSSTPRRLRTRGYVALLHYRLM